MNHPSYHDSRQTMLNYKGLIEFGASVLVSLHPEIIIIFGHDNL